MFALEARLASWLAQLPKNLTYSKRNLYEQLIVHGQSTYIMIHALYHQSRLVLHASLVPLFSGFPMPEEVSSDLVAMSAQIGLQSAQKISQLGADFLALDYCSSHLPAFLGYCMYVSASTQLVLLSSQDERLASQARYNLISNVKFLRAIKEYWSNLQRLVRRWSDRNAANFDSGRGSGFYMSFRWLVHTCQSTRATVKPVLPRWIKLLAKGDILDR
jgi:hypothetical protein